MTKIELIKALDDALATLAYKISLAHGEIIAERRAIRHYPDCRLFVERLEYAVRSHDRAKSLSWLAQEQAREVRARAAKFIREDLATSRKLRPRAFPARPVMALAA